ncbi:hypothetical protein Pcinc_022117 [Petrolisthes cinctipes]|uniref:Chitin-binding type-2 domain-containing protein n=1 Tax=Petrolisthes cinctipes TaxID=88211 RepID=A0AAE1FET3_PETCI|nr:hypothetical protein Pcinc_022117 [Petrolisthes cinctipes]
MSFGCEPDCTGKEHYDKVTNPRNCSEYYVCDGDENHSQQPLHCPDGNVFSDETGECVAGPGTTTPTTGCVTSLICTSAGYFSKCPDICQPQYFACSANGVEGIIHSCSGGLVFNTNPDYPYCILPENCPYNPNK